ncbi:MAG TPA: hypothetical protein PLP29_06790 [Candidatus Ozemobacteraceae bacterium]|nr:hypothetical protein [Candidatus Ozemobacteraceae bacterium]
MNRIQRITAMAAFAGMFLGLAAPAARAEGIAELDAAYVAEIQRNSQTVSHREGLKNTIERVLDCAANGRIDVALVGMGDVSDWVIDAWSRTEKEYQEVSISRYGMELDARLPGVRTDFYRFRTIRMNGEVAETLFQDITKSKKAAMICTFVDGDPTGQDKPLATVLENLLAAVEEGQITMQPVNYVDAPQRPVQLWKKYSPAIEDPALVRVERFTTDTAGGEDTYWKLFYRDPNGGYEQTMLVWHDRMVYCDLNGRIIVE